jgi:carbamoyltransferase
VCGLALLQTEQLGLANGDLTITPALLKSTLLASAAPSGNSFCRLLRLGNAIADNDCLSNAQFVSSSVFSGESRDGQIACCAVLDNSAPNPRYWIGIPPTVTLVVSQNGQNWTSSGDGWCALDISIRPGSFNVSVSTEGHDQCGFLAIRGCFSLKIQKQPNYLARRPLIVIGISASHNAAACLMADGDVKVAIQLERLTRRKYDGQPFLRASEAIQYCLDATGIHPSRVDLFAFNSQPLLPGWVGLSQPSADANFLLFDVFGAQSRFVSHHLAHAFAAYATSGFPKSAVLVCDGSGGSVFGADDLVMSGSELKGYLNSPASRRPALHVSSVYRFEGRDFSLLDRTTADSFNVRCGSSSLGEAYAAVSQYIFGSWMDGGKLMGLAAYGDADAAGPSLLEREVSGQLRLRQNWQDGYRQTSGVQPMHPKNRNLAARLQRDLECWVLNEAQRALSLSGEDHLAYGGGLALNCAANSRVAKEAAVRGFHIFPASNDAGVAVGAAYAAAAAERSQKFFTVPWLSDFRGYHYKQHDYTLAIKQWKPWLTMSRYDSRDIAQRLASGQIIGWFMGGAEFGPRALGHRSILADPRSRLMRDRINREIKHREDFRPFAPIVPADRAAQFFELSDASQFMLFLVQLRPEYQANLQAVSHEDGTARVQTLTASENPVLHDLLLEFESVAGLPILLNTSLNGRGQPIVETPLEAIELFLSVKMDALVLDNTTLQVKTSSALSESSKIMLTPAARVFCQSRNGDPRFVLASDAREDSFAVSPALFHLLAHSNGNRSIESIMQNAGADQLTTGDFAVLEALIAERVILHLSQESA